MLKRNTVASPPFTGGNIKKDVVIIGFKTYRSHIIVQLTLTGKVSCPEVKVCNERKKFIAF